MKTRILILIAAVMLTGHALAGPMESANYKMPASVVASGGGAASSANYQLEATIGEPAIGPTDSSNYDLYAGFLAALMAILPRAGDMNADGVVDTADVLLLLQITGGLKNAADGQPANGDVTGNGRIDLDDAAKVLRYLNGLQPTLP